MKDRHRNLLLSASLCAMLAASPMIPAAEPEQGKNMNSDLLTTKELAIVDLGAAIARKPRQIGLCNPLNGREI